MKNKLQIIPTDLLHTYLKQVPKNLQTRFEALKDAEISSDSFDFYVSVSSVYSSKIEGETIELDSYIKGIDINHLQISEPIKMFLKKGLAVEPNDRFNNFSDMQKQWDYVKKYI